MVGLMWSLSTSAVGVKKLFAYRICIMYHICIDTLYIDTIRKDLILESRSANPVTSGPG